MGKSSVGKTKDQGLAYSYRALKHKDFRIFWLGALTSSTGTWISAITVPYVLYQMTGSALWIAWAAAAQFIPSVLTGPLGGALADRFPRRAILLCTQSVNAALAVALWAVWASGLHNPYLLLGLLVAMGCMIGLNLPAWQSYVNDLVPREDLLSAVTLNSLQINAARAFGPAIAGVVLAAWGPTWAFFLNALSFLFVIGALLAGRARAAAPAPRGTRLSVFGGFAEATRYAVTQRGILIAILVSFAIGFLGNPLFQLTVVFASDVFSVGALGLGLMNAAMGVGAVIAAPLVTGWRKVFPASRTVQYGLLIYGAFTILFAASRSIVLGVACLVVIGACFLAVISSVNTSLQLIVAEHLRGRVISVRQTFFTLSMPLGAMAQGWLTDLWDVQVATIVAGACMILFSLAFTLYRRGVAFRRLDDPHDDSLPIRVPSAP